MQRTLVSAGIAVVAVVIGLWPAGAEAAPRGFEKRTKVNVEVQSLTAETVGGREDGPATISLDSSDPRETKLELVWPEPGDLSELRFRVSHAPPPAGSERAVTLDARLVLPDGTRVHASRTVAFDESETILFEIHRFDNRSLTLSVQLTVEVELVVSTHPTPGSQIRFRLEIVRVIEGREVVLENNYLNTLMGEDVSYGFQLADSVDADAVQITIHPRRLIGNIAEIDVSVNGRLQMGDELMVIGRSERWMASRDATSTLAFESGDPPTGYRFRITARF